MSRASKMTILGSTVFAGGCFLYSLYDKELQLARLRKGAILDRERQKLKKKNLQDLERNIAVEEQYKKSLGEKNSKEGAVS